MAVLNHVEQIARKQCVKKLRGQVEKRYLSRAKRGEDVSAPDGAFLGGRFEVETTLGRPGEEVSCPLVLEFIFVVEQTQGPVYPRCIQIETPRSSVSGIDFRIETSRSIGMLRRTRRSATSTWNSRRESRQECRLGARVSRRTQFTFIIGSGFMFIVPLCASLTLSQIAGRR